MYLSFVRDRCRPVQRNRARARREWRRGEQPVGGGRRGARPARESDRASARLPHTLTGVLCDGARRVASREGVLPDAAPLLQAGTFFT